MKHIFISISLVFASTLACDADECSDQLAGRLADLQTRVLTLEKILLRIERQSLQERAHSVKSRIANRQDELAELIRRRAEIEPANTLEFSDNLSLELKARSDIAQAEAEFDQLGLDIAAVERQLNYVPGAPDAKPAGVLSAERSKPDSSIGENK